MAATIKIKNSSTASAVPTSSDLVQGELAVNVTDKRIFTENASGTVVELGTNPSILTLPDGSASAPTLTNDGDTNTGIFFPAADTVGITTGGTERARVDSSGNLGLGVTPSAWTTFTAQQIGPTGAMSLYAGADNVNIGANVYFNSGYKRVGAYAASAYQQGAGAHYWFTAPSSTAGSAITFTQAMTLDANGCFSVGGTSPYRPGGSEQKSIEIYNTSTYSTLYLTANSRAIIGALGVQSSDNTYHVGTNTNHPLLFDTNGTERARIDSSGNLLVGTTSVAANAKVTVSFSGGSASSRGLVMVSGSTANTAMIGFQNPNGYSQGEILTSGTTTTYATSSDYRLKENIAPMTGALAKVALLKPCTYKWKVDGSNGDGFIAHELQEVVPQCVTNEKDAVDEEGNPVYQGIDTSFLVATLTAAIQELKATVDAQAARITALEQA